MNLYRHPLEFCRVLRAQRVGKLCGLDMSPSRIGIAVSDGAQQLALPMAVLRNGSPDRRLAFGVRPEEDAIVRRLQAESIVGVVVGWPLPLQPGASGNSYRLRQTLTMIKRLPLMFPGTVRPQTPILLHDERFSTVMARMQASAMTTAQVKQTGGLDALAAAHILQEYLDYAARSHTLL